MAEIGVISAIVGLAYAGVQLSKTLYTIGTRTVHANHSINRIATGVSLFSSMLKHVGAVLKDAQSLHSQEALDTAHQIVVECERVYEEIGRMVRSLGGKTGEEKATRRSSMSQKVRWHFEQPKVEFLLAQLEYLKTTLSVLIQTLNLAAVTAQARRDDASEQRANEIIHERVHVETLFIAQRLSLSVLNNYQQQATAGADPNDRSVTSSPSESEHTLEDAPGPRLLTQEPHRPSSLIHLPFMQNNLSFLDRTSASQHQPLSPVTQAPNVVDQLLDNWTILPELVPIPKEEPKEQPKERDIADEEEALPASEDTPAQMATKVDEKPQVLEKVLPPPPRARADPPELTLQRVESAPQNDELAVTSPSQSPSYGYPPANQFLDIRGQHGQIFQNPRMPPQFPIGGPPVGQMTLSRSMSVPEMDSPPQSRNGPPPMQSLQYYQGPPPLQQDPRGITISPVSYNANPPSYSISMGSRQPPSPHVSPYGTPNYHAGPTSFDTGMARQMTADSRLYEDEESMGGLNIPWRIRIGQKYWDFLDAKLVGPRTPYLPTEPMSWVYSHDYAHTEVSSAWVCPEAISEHKYPFYEMYHEDTHGPNYEQEKRRHYCILQPLKFEEIETLVNRTVQIYQQNASQSRSQQRPPPRTQGQPRSVSFTDMPSRHLRADSGWERGDRSPRTSGEFGAAGASHGQWRDGSRYMDDWDRDSDERPPSRAKNRDKGRGRDSDHPPKKKTSKVSTATTIAKIGGLIAMIDGLDGLII